MKNENIKNIYQRINAVMGECPYIKKEDTKLGKGHVGKGVFYDTLIAVLRPLLTKHGIVLVINQKNMNSLHVVEDSKQRVYQGEYTLKLVNVDHPDDFVEYSTFAHGMDAGDKGPGKSQTYAVKTMLCKAFAIETGIDDESHAEKIDKNNTIDSDQFNRIGKYCFSNGKPNKTGIAMMRAYKISNLSLLPKSKYDDAIKRAENHFNKTIETDVNITTTTDNGDSSQCISENTIKKPISHLLKQHNDSLGQY